MSDNIEEMSWSPSALKIISMNIAREGGCHFKLAALNKAFVTVRTILTLKTFIKAHDQEKKESNSDTNKL